MTTGEKIKVLRITRGWSQEDLGKRVGLQKAAINKYETGRVVNIKKSTLLKLASVFNITPADLLDDDKLLEDTTGEERDLLHRYRKLNDLGRQKAQEYITDLEGNTKYILKKGDEDATKETEV